MAPSSILIRDTTLQRTAQLERLRLQLLLQQQRSLLVSLQRLARRLRNLLQTQQLHRLRQLVNRQPSRQSSTVASLKGYQQV